ncbi:aminoacyl-tRNA deacylase [Alloscardovia venturai]|uniref:Cys-tRNA(Pro)/Cys-tRNA(Cys) deacylase n=1 Tax=Alloscardovia venturai TaxID=1769421 RepID=A0ABW2YAI5_9BIFI
MGHKKRKTTENSVGVGTPALMQLEEAGISFTIYTYKHDTLHETEGFGLEGAAQIDKDPNSMYKTLLVDIGERPGHDLVTAVVPVTCHLNLKQLAATVGVKKAQMADPDVAQKQTGYVVGGISPLGQKMKHVTVLDESMLNFEEVLISGGRRGLSVGVSPLELQELLGAKIAPIAAQGSHPL